MRPNTITIMPLHASDRSMAEALSLRLALPINDTDCDYALCVDDGDLYVMMNKPDQSHSKLSPLRVDFSSAQQKYRYQNISRKNELLAKAIGLKQGRQLSVLDATAGLGVDSVILATFGCHVMLCEHHPILYILLEHGIKKGLQDSDIKPIIKRIHLIGGEFIHYITQEKRERDGNNSNGSDIDVIYLDPMFPPRAKSAMVKKNMQYLHMLNSEPSNLRAMLEVALQYAKHRVVVKRPRKDKERYYHHQPPNHSIYGKSIRYDVYLTHNMRKISG